MIKNRILKVLNPIIAILILNQAITGMFQEPISHHTYEVVHGGASVVTVIAVIIYVTLDWKWISSNYFKRKA